ncbi:MAG: hypothetical protein ACLRPR_07170 [Eisenbergiella sp.]
MKKKKRALVYLTAAVLLLAGCGSSSGSAESMRMRWQWKRLRRIPEADFMRLAPLCLTAFRDRRLCGG